MDDDLRTAIVEFLDNSLCIITAVNIERMAEEMEEYLNEIGYAFYDERGPAPLKL